MTEPHSVVFVLVPILAILRYRRRQNHGEPFFRPGESRRALYLSMLVLGGTLGFLGVLIVMAGGKFDLGPVEATVRDSFLFFAVIYFIVTMIGDRRRWRLTAQHGSKQ